MQETKQHLHANKWDKMQHLPSKQFNIMGERYISKGYDEGKES